MQLDIASLCAAAFHVDTNFSYGSTQDASFTRSCMSVSGTRRNALKQHLACLVEKVRDAKQYEKMQSVFGYIIFHARRVQTSIDSQQSWRCQPFENIK